MSPRPNGNNIIQAGRADSGAQYLLFCGRYAFHSGDSMLKKAERGGWSFRIVLRYLLFQLPGWIVVTLILMLVDHWLNLPTWAIVAPVLIMIVKDAVMFPILWRAYDPNPENIAYRLIGERATVREKLSPRGYVELHGELWKAELTSDRTTVEDGRTVLVVEVRGLTLLVQPEQ